MGCGQNPDNQNPKNQNPDRSFKFFCDELPIYKVNTESCYHMVKHF